MRPHHFLLMLISIVVSLLLSLSTFGHSTAKDHKNFTPEWLFQMPWGGSSAIPQVKFDRCAINAACVRLNTCSSLKI